MGRVRVLLFCLLACGSLAVLSACTRVGASGPPIVLPTDTPQPPQTQPSQPSQGGRASGQSGGQTASQPAGGQAGQSNQRPVSSTPTGKLGPTGLPELDTIPERPLYTLNVTLDYDNNVIHAQERIEFRNPTGAAVSEIKFNVPPAHRPGIIEIRDARIFAQPQPLAFALNETVLTVQLPAPLPSDAGIAMAFDFVIQIPLQETITGIGGDDSSRGPNSLTAGHWYIMLAPFRDGAWDTPAYVPIGDPYVSDLADYEVSVLAPENVIVAGAGDEQHDGRLWRYTLPQARMFAFAASDVYKVDSIEQDGVTFILYSYPRHRGVWEAVLYTAARAVKLFSEIYGAYPYKVFRIVETGRSQGQEYSGLVGIGTVLYSGYPGRGSRHDLIATVVHETTHQWWFHVVGDDQVRTPWLDESFARLGELLFYQKYYPKDVDWWYKYYITGKVKPQGNIDLPIYGYEDSHAYVEAVYRRGLMFLNEVRSKIGADTFDAALKDYFQAEAYKVTTQDAFFDALARHTDTDISAITKNYFSASLVLPCVISANAPGCR
jgi:hypothetical protein